MGSFVMFVMSLIVGVPLIFIGYSMINKGFKSEYLESKYEFEHRTDGGVVQFDSFEASQQFRRQQARTRVKIFMGLIPLGFGSLFLGGGLGASFESVGGIFLIPIIFFGLLYLTHKKRID